MNFKTLENTDKETLLEVFNLAFSDYFVPVKMTLDQLSRKLDSEHIRLDLSAGAYSNGKLVGFVLHGIDTIDGQNIAYNAGTGVLQDQRGQSITNKLYEFILPKLKSAQVKKVVLEVMSQNAPAISCYKKIGFVCRRNLLCYKGAINSKANIIAGFDIQKLPTNHWAQMQSFWDWEPAWQNSISTLDKLSGANITLGLFHDQALLGYLNYNPSSKRVHQFAVNKDCRRQKAATWLFTHIANNSGAEISLINIDSGSVGTISFLENIGLVLYVKQHEMAFRIN